MEINQLSFSEHNIVLHKLVMLFDLIWYYYMMKMGMVAEKEEIDFVISTGDNFYDDGLINALDPAFHLSFTDIYTAPSLQKTWYNGMTYSLFPLFFSTWLTFIFCTSHIEYKRAKSKKTERVLYTFSSILSINYTFF